MPSVKGQLFILSAPSGAGKTSLVKRAISELDNLMVSVSHTTRGMRPGEVDGRDYFFTDRDNFESMIAEQRFLEYADVFGNYYGTSEAAVRDNLDAGRDVILEIDWQGGNQVREKFNDVLSIFILPPSRETLISRLKARAQDSDQVIEKRTAEAVAEMREYHHGDYLVINDDFEQALLELKSVIVSQRVTRARQSVRHATLISSLIA